MEKFEKFGLNLSLVRVVAGGEGRRGREAAGGKRGGTPGNTSTASPLAGPAGGGGGSGGGAARKGGLWRL